ncbi:hypothetical protein ACKGJN_03440 [Gillisia sp. Q332]|uniref:hypothetical protein n=1 Tax=Gillisia xinjiangensis TaxID=3384765 RepID=UPI00391BCED6
MLQFDLIHIGAFFISFGWMKFYVSFLIFFSVVLSAFSQKDLSATYDAQNIKKVYIFTDEVFRINLKTSEKDKIILTSHSEGEYFNDISLNVELLQDRVILTTQFRKILQSGYDKLSAHKVFSLEITLEIPEGLEVFIKSNIASVSGSGTYKNLEVELKSGYCELTSFMGNALVNTYNGSIDVQTQNAEITAISRNGNVLVSPEITGKNKIHLTTINGNIRVREN